MQFKLSCLVALAAASAVQVQAQTTSVGAQLCTSIGMCIKSTTTGNYCYDDIAQSAQALATTTDPTAAAKILCTQCYHDVIVWFQNNPTAGGTSASQFQGIITQVNTICGANFLSGNSTASPTTGSAPTGSAPTGSAPASSPTAKSSPTPKSSADTSKLSLGAVLVGGVALAAMMF
ncbi:uncharacterized protein BJ171DRAFT_512581 [Polychytrium aggregatum]|uniref:uncharacterized protein n=1 Tax=Polychytrium aggregatum TaxID=110093 RepID=UPI0022FEBCEB|nr:uncharacterized protein BJ171DRAFT_512581 [Polychytrium aggregatum]KAI9202913.1 hypothetical protein BJ171DRAFT_512581 [Polychytrium aggregatum]